MSLSEIVRKRRGELGLTQDQVAARAGISKPYLSNIETDRTKNPPTDKVLVALERVLEFERGQLTRLAHLARTPADVRQEHEMLEADVCRPVGECNVEGLVGAGEQCIIHPNRRRGALAGRTRSGCRRRRRRRRLLRCRHRLAPARWLGRCRAPTCGSQIQVLPAIIHAQTPHRPEPQLSRDQARGRGPQGHTPGTVRDGKVVNSRGSGSARPRPKAASVRRRPAPAPPAPRCGSC